MAVVVALVLGLAGTLALTANYFYERRGFVFMRQDALRRAALEQTNGVTRARREPECSPGHKRSAMLIL